MINFNTNSFKQLLNIIANPENPYDKKIKNYEYLNKEIVVFNLKFQDIDVAIRIANMLGEWSANFNIHTFYFPNSNEIDFVQFQIHSINDDNFHDFIKSI